VDEPPSLQLDLVLQSPRVALAQDPAAAESVAVVVDLGECLVKTDLSRFANDDSRRLYDCIRVRCTSLQAFFMMVDPGAPLRLDRPMFMYDEPGHLLRPINLDLDVFLSVLPDNPRVNTMRLHIKLHSVHLLLSSAKYHHLLEFSTSVTESLGALTSSDVSAAPTTEATASATADARGDNGDAAGMGEVGEASMGGEDPLQQPCVAGMMIKVQVESLGLTLALSDALPASSAPAHRPKDDLPAAGPQLRRAVVSHDAGWSTAAGGRTRRSASVVAPRGASLVPHRPRAPDSSLDNSGSHHHHNRRATRARRSSVAAPSSRSSSHRRGRRLSMPGSRGSGNRVAGSLAGDTILEAEEEKSLSATPGSHRHSTKHLRRHHHHRHQHSKGHNPALVVPPELALAQRRAVHRLFDFTDDFGPRAEVLASARLNGLSCTLDMNSHGMEIDVSLATLLVRDVLRYKCVPFPTSIPTPNPSLPLCVPNKHDWR